MYPASFDYHRPGSVDEALELLADHADEEVEVLAGGHSLIPTMKSGLANPDIIVDIGHIEDLRGIEIDGDATVVGALTPYVDVANDESLAEHVEVVAEAAGAIGDIQVRNMGTMGGNLAHSDPASDLPAAALAADATLHARGPEGERTIPVDEFFVAMYATALEPGELLTAVELPHAADGTGGAYVKKSSPSSGYAMVGVAAVIEIDGDEIAGARVAANGALDHAARLEAVEEALVGEALESDVAEAAGEHATDGVEEWELMDDLQASGEFRANLLRVYTARAVGAAIERAG